MKISAQILVENEENFVWFAVMSVLPFVDEVRIVDAGSVDKTFEILQTIKNEFPHKVFLTQTHKLTPEEYPHVRDEMMRETSCEWIVVVDGDEIWWSDKIRFISQFIRQFGSQYDSIATPFLNCIGDIFHVQTKSAGRYQIDSRQGHITIHAINKSIPNLQVKNEYGKEGYFSFETPVQELNPKRRYHVETPCFLHLTHLKRTRLHSNKLKREVGIELPLDFFFPEVFFLPRPSVVKNPWVIPTLKEQTLNVMLGMSRKAKRWIK